MLNRKLALVRLGLVGVAITLALSGARLFAGLPLQENAADDLGLSAQRLEQVPALLKREIDAKRYAGVVWLVARDGAIASHGALGLADVASAKPMTEDTVFRIFSMSKIVTTVTLLTLVEEGRLLLDDPVERYLPELANRQVLVGGTADAPQLEPAKGSITIRHLLTHTSGLPYDLFAEGTAQEIWTRAEIWAAPTLKDFVRRVASLPLVHQPGEKWTYGVNTDILGAVIEAVTGQDLETAMRERVLKPLRMTETTFRPDAALSARVATIHHRTPNGLERDDAAMQFGTLAFPSGGGGLFSTLHDYTRFAQMLLNRGELDDVRVLGRKTVEMMTSDQTSHIPPGIVWAPPSFGLGVRIRQNGPAASFGTVGMFGWDGYATTYVSMDPKEGLLLIALFQHVPFNEDSIFEKFTNVVYQTLEE